MFLLLLIASIKGRVFYTPFRTNFHSISEINQMDMEKLDCSFGLLQISQSIKAWQEILENEKELDTDIQSLLSIHVQVKEYRQLPDQSQIFTQIKTSVLINLREIGVLGLSPYQQWRKDGFEGLQEQLSLLDQAISIDESLSCYDRIEKLIEKMLSEREKIKQQFKQPQITINIINNKANQVSKKQESCESQGVKLDGFKEKDETKNKEIPEKSESLSDSEQDEEVNTDAKKKISDVNNEEPDKVRADDKDNTKNKKIPQKSESVSDSKQEQQFEPVDKKPPLAADSAIIKNKSSQEEPLMDKQIMFNSIYRSMVMVFG